MKRFFLMVITVGLMVPAGAYAQEVYKNAGNQVILDLTVDAGMPADAVTNEPKYVDFTPSESELGANNKHDESINAKVFQKLEVAKHDLSGNGTIASGGGEFVWVNAFNYCKALGTGWRLPTQRELQLMCIFKIALEDIFKDSAINGSAFLPDYYWSSTEINSTTLRIMTFKSGNTLNYSKTAANRARCVREVVTN